jgi:hypothetical protein
MTPIFVSCFHVHPFLFLLFLSSFLSVRIGCFFSSVSNFKVISFLCLFFMCFLSISIYPGTDHHGLPRSSSPISPVVCCSFLVPSRSQSQLVVCFRVPWPALLLFPSWARPSLWLFQRSAKEQFFSCWHVPVRLFPLSCTHTPLPTATRCSNDSLVLWESNVYGYHLPSPLISQRSKHWARSKRRTCSYYIDFVNDIAIWN